MQQVVARGDDGLFMGPSAMGLLPSRPVQIRSLRDLCKRERVGNVLLKHNSSVVLAPLMPLSCVWSIRPGSLNQESHQRRGF
jgi:hypothetical protein